MSPQLTDLRDVLRECDKTYDYLGQAEGHEQDILAALPKRIQTHYTSNRMEFAPYAEWQDLVCIVAERRSEKLMRRILDYAPSATLETDGMLAFKKALHCKNLQTLHWLLKTFGKKHIATPDKDGDAPLHNYIRCSAPKIIGLSPWGGSEEENRTTDGQIISLLIKDGGADPNQKNAAGETPLVLALKSKTTWLVSSLLQLGASTLVSAPEGKSILALAHETGNEQTIAEIESHKAYELRNITLVPSDIKAPQVAIGKPMAMKL